MTKEERRELAARLAKADATILNEIIREAESFLAAQLQAGLASDMRAMTLAAVLAAVIAGLVAGVSTLVAANISLLPHIIPTAIFIVFSFVGFISAIHAARPTLF